MLILFIRGKAGCCCLGAFYKFLDNYHLEVAVRGLRFQFGRVVLKEDNVEHWQHSLVLQVQASSPTLWARLSVPLL